MSSRPHDAESAHHEVAEHEDACPDFGDAAEIVRKVRGRGRPHADFGAAKAMLAQTLRAGHRRIAFLSRHGGDLCGRLAGIGAAGVGDDALQRQLRVCQSLCDVEQLIGSGLHAGAVSVAVDFDHDIQRRVALRGKDGERLGHLDAVQDDRQCHAAGAQFDHMLQFVGRNADRIEDVGKAEAGKVLRLLQCGDGNRPGFRADRAPHYSIDLLVFTCGRNATPSRASWSRMRLMLPSILCWSRTSTGVSTLRRSYALAACGVCMSFALFLNLLARLRNRRPCPMPSR